jgi:hypothetical protein
MKKHGEEKISRVFTAKKTGAFESQKTLRQYPGLIEDRLVTIFLFFFICQEYYVGIHSWQGGPTFCPGRFGQPVVLGLMDKIQYRNERYF